MVFNGPGCSPCTVPNGVLTNKTATSFSGPATLNTAGSYNVSVQNGPSGTASNTLPLTISTPTPALSSIGTTPNPPLAAQQFSFTLAGRKFDPNTIQVLF